ncbi:lamin tail domain-containing protein [Caldibacillus lycopersici]|uniref:Lamin tail domain-containing protein n=1 Tax=Perspicuibacillus lycopersici TaxID=1325689 RepID=A0AAE3IS39_9BACI|nr:lamin tail domain-containing protein [Perspicuibacillus lycopersici]MCU9612618.1 lamin tail domain-containing protein [Perspicuibacillus lycopersici]
MRRKVRKKLKKGMIVLLLLALFVSNVNLIGPPKRILAAEADGTSENVETVITSPMHVEDGKPTDMKAEDESNPDPSTSTRQSSDATREEQQTEYIEQAATKTTGNVPPILITEIMPNNAGSDDYEYFEVYNNSNQPIVLDHYTFALRYTDGSGNEDVKMNFAPVTLEPEETIIFWNNLSNKALADFNSHYQLNLSAENVVEYSGAPGFYNSGNRAVVIKDRLGNDVVWANYLLEDIGNGLSVHYQFPEVGIEMDKFAQQVQPTPGTLVAGQAPEQVVNVPDNQAPEINHTPIEQAIALEDLVIPAEINDDQQNARAFLYYQVNPNTAFEKIEMETSDNHYFQAVIAKELLSQASISYYIEATDQNHRVNFAKDIPVQVPITGLEDIDFNQLPPLMISEISPNSNGSGTDYFEYFELYNNTDQPITLTNYSFQYLYTDSGEERIFQVPPTTIESQETIVFWFNNGNKTVEQFNQNFGTNLTEEQIIPFTEGFPGFANGGNRAIVIRDNTGTSVISAAYFANETDNTGAVVEYKYPLAGTEMVTHRILANPTPGTIEEEQVPATPVHVPEVPVDTEPPVITHSAIIEGEILTPIQVTATVTDNSAIPIVTLYYKEENEDNFSSVSMRNSTTDADASTYIGEIPATSVVSSMVYYIEATDGFQSVQTAAYTIHVEQPNINYNQLPEFLVTEVVPDTTNVGTADGYEFIEIYNNTNEPMNFKDYKLYYRYGTDAGTDVVWPAIPEEVIIPAGETLVFWIINDQNRELTVADFNAHYDSQLVENENIVRIYSGGMANGSMRGLVVATNTHKEVSVAYYFDEPNVDDTMPDKGILYRFPTNKSTQSTKIAIMDATPGIVKPFQVPAQPVQHEEDSVPPSIENLTDVTELDQKDDIPIVINATDDKVVKSVRLFYKINNQSEYQEAILQEDYDDMLYHHTIYSPDLIGNQYVDYYFEVSDGQNEVISDTYRVTITSDLDQSSLRLNVADGEILNGTAVLKGTSETDNPEDVTLFIDGTEVTDDLYHSVERTAYFAFEVNGLNTYFQNAVTMGDDILYLMDDDWLTQWKTFSIPIESDRLTANTTITVRSGNKASPFDLDSPENRDDYDLRNVRLVLADGTVLKDPNFSDASQILKMNDANPFVDFHFSITEEHTRSKTYDWDTTVIADGEHEIKTTDNDEEKIARILIDNTAPVIQTTIMDNKEYKGAFTIDAEVTDAIAGVGDVQVTLDDKAITLPFETASSKLLPGEHMLTIVAIDKVGNNQEITKRFSVVNENPLKPVLVAPNPVAGTPIAGDPRLQVRVTDPTGDELDVTFYQGFQYDPSQIDHISGYKNASDTEPPQTMVPEGEQAFNDEDLSLVSDMDGNYLVTDSDTQFPYHRFDVTIDRSVDENDIVELVWNGNSLEGRKVSMYAWNHTTQDWTLIDSDVAGTVDFELKGNVAVRDFVKDAKVNVLIQDEIPSTPDDYDYTFVWMSDTQYYAESYPYIFDRQTEWIAEMQEEMKIKYVFHTGDLVNVSTEEYQWEYADEYMKVLDDENIPYGVLAGNHDVNQVNNDYTDYYRYFGADRFENKPYYGGSYENNRGHYDLISAGGNDYIMVYLGWGVTDEGIQWMNDVLAAYPDRKAILSFHEYLQASGTRHPLGEKLYNEVVVPNKNVIAVLSGHYHEAQTLVNEIDDNGDGTVDRKVYQMLADYQAGPEGGQGYMRLLHFDQENNRILVNTYSPYLDDYNYYDGEAYPGKDEFVINLDLSAVKKRVATDYFSVNVYTDSEIGKDEKIQSGEIAETVWPGLENDVTYSWYAVAEDKYTGRTVSNIWTFVKGEDIAPPSTTDPADENDPEPSDPANPESPPVDEGPGNGQPSNQEDTGQSKEEINLDQRDKDQEPEKNLPNTANNFYNLLFTGSIILLLTAKLFIYQKRRNRKLS